MGKPLIFRHILRYPIKISDGVQFALDTYQFADIFIGMTQELTRFEALKACLKKAGNQQKMAKDFGCTQSTVSRMVQVRRMSHQYVLKAERLYGVSRHALRPDIYPVEIEYPRGDNDRFYAVDQGCAA
jgi:DNA-binding transcriptional regulator YdaS (Cro superfamily)